MDITPDILINYLENPDVMNSSSNKSISDLIERYPFFQTARLLQIKNLQKIYNAVEKQDLNLTAAYVTDRKVLYYLLYKLNPTLPGDSGTSVPQNRIASFEKEYKDSLKENIAETLNKQLHYYELEPDHEIELIPGLAIDIRKEYGNGIELDERSFSIRFRKETHREDVFELTDEPETTFLTDLDTDLAAGRSSTDETFELAETEFFEGEDRKEQSESPIFKILQETTGREKSGQGGGEDQESAELPDEPGEILSYPGYNLTEPEKEKADIQYKKEKNDSLIDNFIKTNPRIVPAQTSDINKDVSVESVIEHESFFTDTLAQIYVKQGNYAKAILAYEKLSLKYPEKSTYFADQISEIKKRISKS